MKGPGNRNELDVRRLWECPHCGRKRKAEGVVTALLCGCQPDGVQMRLVEGLRQVRKFPFPAPEPPPLEETPPFAGELNDAPIDTVAIPAADAATWVEEPAPGMPDASAPSDLPAN